MLQHISRGRYESAQELLSEAQRILEAEVMKRPQHDSLLLSQVYLVIPSFCSCFLMTHPLRLG